ncbi:MAG: HD domain-containing protein [Planctomycetes bacterium]|nr:HD domain-containing protein [Planctomycetota bacterium]
MPYKPINALKPGENIKQVFFVAEKQLLKTKQGKPYLTLELADKTGRIKAVMWDNADAANGTFKTGDFAHCQALVEIYKDELQLKINAVAPANPDDVDVANFTAHTAKDVELLFEELKETLATVKEPSLSKLVNLFLNDKEFVRQFKSAPAAIKNHHPYVGGLLEHTANMMQLAKSITAYYPFINPELLLVGVFLHDIGKIKEYAMDVMAQMTDEGELLGHTIIGITMLEEKLKEIPDFPADKATMIKHLIGSHHGDRQYGAPVLPMTPEALMLHYLDNLDAKMGGYQQLTAKSDPKEHWTEWSKSLERRFYKSGQ